MEKRDFQQTRRDALMTIGGLGLLISCADDDTGEQVANQNGNLRGTNGLAGATSTPVAAPTSTASTPCGITIPQDEGPFFLENRPEASDLVTGWKNPNASNGVPLHIRFSVYRVSGDSCTPLPSVQVDIWACDTFGLYSGECVQGTQDDLSLRGYQYSNADGVVEFNTTYPGWYAGRTIHIHVKLRLTSGATRVLDFTTQLYINDEINDVVMALPAYNARGPRDQANATDTLYANAPAAFEEPADAGAPFFRLPPNACEIIADGGTLFDGVELVIPPAAPLSAESAGPRLTLDTRQASDGNGYTGSFSFGVVMA